MEQRLVEPFRAQLERLSGQIHGLQQQLDGFTTRPSEGIAERASRHVAAIVEAAERSAADIRTAARADAAAMREKLGAELEAELQRIRAQAHFDAARIRTEAHARAVHVTETALMKASSEIRTVCGRLADELEAGAAVTITDMGNAADLEGDEPRRCDADGAPRTPARIMPSPPVAQIAGHVQDAVDELQRATAMLERSLRDARHPATALS